MEPPARSAFVLRHAAIVGSPFAIDRPARKQLVVAGISLGQRLLDDPVIPVGHGQVQHQNPTVRRKKEPSIALKAFLELLDEAGVREIRRLASRVPVDWVRSELASLQGEVAA